MKKFSIILMLCLLVVSIPFSASTDTDRLILGEYIIEQPDREMQPYVLTSDEEWPYTAGVDYVDGEILVMTDYYVDMSDFSESAPYIFNDIPIDSIEPLFNATTEAEISARIERMGNIFSYHIVLNDSVSVQDAVYTLRNNKDIVVAEPNFIYDAPAEYTDSVEETVEALSTVSQWAHDYLEMEDVWGYGFTGSSDVTVAIIDIGFVQHPDLSDNVDWENGFDATNNSNSITPNINNNHGIRVAGIIGANYDDEYINGICQNITLLPVKLGGTTGISGSYLVNALEGAIERGADIINMSFSMSTLSNTAYSLVENNDILCVVSAGNSNKNMIDENATKGKRTDDSRWIVVGAMYENETRRSDSNYSLQYCDLFAPGNNLAVLDCTLSEDLVPSDFTVNFNGKQTSLATPHVAAACALIWSHATHLTAPQVKDLIMANVKRVDGLRGYCVSGGTLSIKNAVETLYTECRGAYSKGDLNGDGFITDEDKEICRSIYNELIIPTEEQIYAANINNDDRINIFDYLAITQYINHFNYFPPY